MTRTLAALLVLGLPGALAGTVPAAAQTEDAPQLSAVSAHLKALGTMTADFTQSSGNGQVLTGKLTMARPGRIRFQYQEGVPILVVSDGKALTLIDYKVRQVSRWPIKSTPLGVLLDPERDPGKFAKVLPQSTADRILVEARDAKHPEYGVITLALSRRPGAPAGLVLDGWTVVDSQNARTTVTLDNQRFGVPVEKDAFQFRDPRRPAAGARG